jgi:hypothetical protein
MNYQDKINQLASLIETEQLKDLIKSGLDCESNIINRKVKVLDGTKYTKINIGPSGHLMIDKSTETIYGIKGYGQIHKGHVYGTLDTINQFYWGTYSPFKKSTGFFDN